MLPSALILLKYSEDNNMELHKDFKELFVLFNKHHVKYIIVEGYALAYHGAPRYTGDIDILVNTNTENASRVISALQDFGFGSLGLKEADFTEPGQVIQLGVPPVRIDLLTSITGVSWHWSYRNETLLIKKSFEYLAS